MEVAIRDGSFVSSVNLSEVAAKLVEFGYADDEVTAILRDTSVTVRDFTSEMAVSAGLLRRQTRRLGLSLGDRACLALARELGLPALTADRNWLTLDAGVRIELCR